MPIHRTFKYHAHVFALALGLGLSLPLELSAAPTTSDETATAQEGESQTAVRPPRLAGTPVESRAVDLLIQMQTRSAGLEFNERKPASDSREVKLRLAPPVDARTQAPVSTTTTNASGLFGTGATPAVQTHRPLSGEARISSEVAAPATGARQSAAAGPSEPPLWMLLPREVIDYVRENRGFVLGSAAAALALLWAVSLAFSRHRA